MLVQFKCLVVLPTCFFEIFTCIFMIMCVLWQINNNNNNPIIYSLGLSLRSIELVLLQRCLRNCSVTAYIRLQCILRIVIRDADLRSLLAP